MTVGVNKVNQIRRGRGRHRGSSNRGSSSHEPTSGDQSGRGGSRGHYNSRGRGGFSRRKSSNRGGFSLWCHEYLPLLCWSLPTSHSLSCQRETVQVVPENWTFCSSL